jgi:hypothetical protein
MYVNKAHQPYSLTFISFVHSSPSHKYPPHTVPILQSCLSFLIPKKMFGGVSQCIPAVNILYFDQFSLSVDCFHLISFKGSLHILDNSTST